MIIQLFVAISLSFLAMLGLSAAMSRTVPEFWPSIRLERFRLVVRSSAIVFLLGSAFAFASIYDLSIGLYVWLIVLGLSAFSIALIKN